MADHWGCLGAAFSSDDVRDALVCALAARAVTLGLTVAPQDVGQAAREGWNHITEDDARALLDPQRSADWLSVPLYVPSREELDEDLPKATFDYWREDGGQIDTLEDYATGRDLAQAAEEIIRYPVQAAIPAHLSRAAWTRLALRPAAAQRSEWI